MWLSKFNEYTARTEGADKVFRVVGYVLRLYLSKTGNNKPLAQLVAALSECRVLLRFFGLAQTISWFQDTINCADGEEREWKMVQIATMLVYYPMEHIYYLSGKGLIPISNRDSLSQWSCRSWFLYMAIEVMLLCKRHRQDLLKPTTDTKLRKAQLRLIALLADMPLALTWSLADGGFLPDYMIGLLGTVSSVAGILNSTM